MPAMGPPNRVARANGGHVKRTAGSGYSLAIAVALFAIGCTATPASTPAPTSAPAATAPKPTTNAAPPAAPTSAPKPAATTAAAAAPTTASAAAQTGTAATPKIAANLNDNLKGKQIKIGEVYSSEGVAWAPNGIAQHDALQIALDEINASGGINGAQLALVSIDLHGNINSMGDAIRKLGSDDNVEVIIGPLASGEGQVAYPVAAQQKVPIICNGCSVPGLLELGKPWAMRLTMQDDSNTEPVIDYVQRTKGFKTAAIAGDIKDTISKYMMQSFWPKEWQKLGVTNLTSEPITFNTGDSSYTAQVTRLKSLNPEAVSINGGPADVAKMIIEMQRQGVKTQLLGSGGLQSAGSAFTDACGDACNGMMSPAQFWPENTDPQVAPIIANFNGKCKCQITHNGSSAYDGVYMIADVMRKGQYTGNPETDRPKLVQDLISLRGFVGTGGALTFTPEGDIVRPSQVAVIENGKYIISLLPR
jgi:branched-chain amino acid transport system substrate-binding protein